MSHYLMQFTGKARYGDWAERLLYNGIGAALQINGNAAISTMPTIASAVELKSSVAMLTPAARAPTFRMSPTFTT
jgi:hypothetical protein